MRRAVRMTRTAILPRFAMSRVWNMRARVHPLRTTCASPAVSLSVSLNADARKQDARDVDRKDDDEIARVKRKGVLEKRVVHRWKHERRLVHDCGDGGFCNDLQDHR